MLGFATIGQAPRNDILASMLGAYGPEVLQAGALDGLNGDALHSLRPQPGEQVLVSRLANGEQVWLSKPRVGPYLQIAVDRLAAQGAQVTCVLCTGAFPGLRSSAQLVFPDQLLGAVVDVLAPCGRLGVLMPDAGQEDMLRSKWQRHNRELTLASASPYRDGESAFRTAAAALAGAGARLIVMDCMGYTREMQAWVAASSAAPVVLSNALVGSILRETVNLPVRLDEPRLAQEFDGVDGF